VNADRWRRVKALFERAVEQPAGERDAFLAAHTLGDDELRRDVESLLASDASEGSVLDDVQQAREALLAASALDTSTDAPPLLGPGDRVGSYEVGAMLGAGGMGEVYRARDPKLNRAVALKVLPSAFALDPGRMARFRREAQLLAALNHPNIAAIYGFEDSSGLHALVLELVEGQTLADRVEAGAIPLVHARIIAAQIVDAIEAAHDKGIVHRDLKPANIKIDPAGAVKVLDFGLAKAAGVDIAAADPAASHDGLILGTAAYMSPEQARGQSVDKRTDIWAFGCVLYEMLTGRRAFPGATMSDTIAKILEREPDWSALPDTVPVPMRRLLFRCLVKDPRHRIRDIGDVRTDLEAIHDRVPGVPHGSEAPRAPAGIRVGRLLVLASAATAAAVSLGFWFGRSPELMENPLANATFTPLTNWDGAEEGAEISPDGKFVAFLADSTGDFNLWLTQVGTGNFSNLTRDLPPLAASGVIVRKLGFSGDGSEIWFNRSDGRPLMKMPLTNGTPQPFLVEGANTPAWSHDGARLAYVFKPNRDDPMFVADRTGADPQQIVEPGAVKNNNPAWSLDDRWIYFVRGPEPQDEIDVDIWRVRATGGLPQRLTDHHAAVNFLAPIDARTVLYVARDENWGGPWLWSLDVERKETRRVSSGVDQYMSVAASRDGRRVVATVANPSASLWRVPVLARTAFEGDAQPYPLPMPTGQTLAPRFGGSALFYLSSRGTADGLWKAEGGVASRVWMNTDGALFEPAVVSRDGRQIAVVARQQGKRRLSLMAADGTNRRTLAPLIDIEGVAGQGAADWSPDGKWIVTGGRDARGAALFKIPVDGRDPVRLRDGTWVNPIWSPDGELIVYGGRSIVGQVKLLALRATDGTPVELPELMVRPGGYRFLPDSRSLVYLPRIQGLDFWLFDLVTNTSRQLTSLSNRGSLRTFDITPDGTHIVFDRSRQNSNVVLIDLPKK
jgi:Tol biopolymer transport system component